jgi:hypothetical protein
VLGDPHRPSREARGRIDRQQIGRVAGEARRALIFAQFEAADLVSVHLVGAVGEPQQTSRRISVGTTVIAGDPDAAKGLDRPANDRRR